jgi:hypothetical protein
VLRPVGYRRLLLLIVLCCGCVRVKPYQRAVHAKAGMQDPEDIDRKLEEHVRDYREGSMGGSGTGGGGCGCN